MNRSGVWENSSPWARDERVSTGSRQRHRTPHRRAADHVLPVVCLLALIAITLLGGSLTLFYWFSAALTSSSMMLCPDHGTCIVEKADAEAACQADAGCSGAGETLGQARGQDTEIIR